LSAKAKRNCHFERSEKSGGVSRLPESREDIITRFFAELKMTLAQIID
jgi:hypothetical protein